jgi:dCTP deaminase
MSEMLRQIANTAVAPELEKIEAVIQQDIPESVRHVCQQLYDSLRFQSQEVQDIQDLTALRSYLFTVSIFVTLVLDASPDRSSWWAEPFIFECYRLCEIADRDVLIIHSRDTSLDDFSVYPNILETTQIFSLDGKLTYKPLDIFVIPAEVKFDISLMALIAHEVGHVYWQINKDLINEKVRGKFKQLPPPIDLTEAADRAKSPLKVASHIEEYLCDQVGRFLLGPAFDFALLKLFYSLPLQGSSDTHPSQENRIILSRERLENYVLIEHAFYSHLKKMRDSLPKNESQQIRKLILDKYERLSATAAEEIYNSCGLRIEDRFSSSCLEQICNTVFLELDGFRPPFETVTLEKPVAINPSDAIVATTIYFHGEAYKESNQFYLDNEQPETEKQEVLRKKLIDHLRYAISLHAFVKFSHQKIENFDSWKKKGTLWDWRVRSSGGQSNSLIVTPTINAKTQYSQNTVDLRLGSSFLVNVPSRYTHIDPAPGKTPLSSYYQEVHVPVGRKFILHPHQFVLASILEYVCLPYDFYALVLGRSTWGRLGLNIATATTVQAGYRGCLTLELRNLGESPLPLIVGTRVAQLCLIPGANQSTGKGYFKSKGKYIGPVSVGVPRIHDDPDWELLKSFSPDPDEEIESSSSIELSSGNFLDQKNSNNSSAKLQPNAFYSKEPYAFYATPEESAFSADEWNMESEKG